MHNVHEAFPIEPTDHGRCCAIPPSKKSSTPLSTTIISAAREYSLRFLLTSLRHKRELTQDSWKSAAHDFCRTLHVAAPTRMQTMYHFLQMEEESILVHRQAGELDADTQAIPVEFPKVALLLCWCSLNAASE